MIQRGHFIVKGRVQGVCFRMYTQDRARELGLTGWVRNQPDGSVEVVVEGREEILRRMEKWCAKGPRHASVTQFTKDYQPASGEFTQFRISQ